MPIGPSSTTAPYLLGDEPNVTITTIATVGDVLGTKSDGITPYRFVGIPDGLGAFDNGDGTVSVLINHELLGTIYNLSGGIVANGVGIERDHGGEGSFVSKLIIDKATLAVVGASDAITQVRLWDRFDSDGDGDANVDWLAAAPFEISRLCSADLAAVSAYYWVDDQGTADTSDDIAYGTQDRIFLTGEEFSPQRDNPATVSINEEVLGGREFALVATGAEAGIAYELAHFGYFAWENAISSPFAQRQTINISMDDGLNGQVYVYVGEKQTTGNAVEMAGLTGGSFYGIRALNLEGNSNNESDALAASGRFEMVAEGDISLLTGIQLDDLSESKGVTSFLRPEDGQFDPTDPSVFYFLTTASFTGQSRLYKLTFDDITQPELGGTIEAVLDSSDIPVNDTVGPRMMDNMTVTPDGKIIIQEDPGNQTFLSRVLEFDPVTGTLSVIATHDPALFTPGLPGFITRDEESSGVIDVTELFGVTDGRAYLSADQIHASAGDPELVEKGQLTLIHVADVRDGTAANDVLNGDALPNTLSGYNGDDVIRGGSGNDVLSGNAGNDRIEGWADNDTLSGGAGIDTLLGDGGDDLIAGGRGNDILTGGAGADKFDFSGLDAGGAETITDFVQGEDLLVLAAGAFVRSERQGDFNFDGIADTRLVLSKGGSVTLLGLADFVASDYVNSASAFADHHRMSDLMQIMNTQVIA